MGQRFFRRIRSQAGVSLLEMLATITITVTVGAAATAQYTNVRRSMAGDGAMRIVMGQLMRAQQLATQQRRKIEVQFIGGNWVKIVRHELDGVTLTTLSNVALEGNMQFALVSGAADTPDAFGNASALAFGNATLVEFSSDGTFIDQNGNPINGTVFLSVGARVSSLRAVTIMGTTGRVRGYRAAANQLGAFVGWNRV